MTTPQAVVEEFDPADLITPPGNREHDVADVKDLLPSIRAHGQLQPGIVSPAPDRPGRHLVLAGNRRALACKILGLKFKAIRVPGTVTAADLIRIRLTENVIRKGMSPFEIAADLDQYMALTGANQERAADEFGFSPAKVSKLLATDKRACPEVRAAVESGAVVRDVGRILAGLPTAEMQRDLLAKAVAGQLKRDTVVRLAKQMTGLPRRHARPRKLSVDGATFVVPGDWPLDRIRDAVTKALHAVEKAIKHNLPPAALGSL
jgi:ParB/RepB/Spo0J family partition protein